MRFQKTFSFLPTLVKGGLRDLNPTPQAAALTFRLVITPRNQIKWRLRSSAEKSQKYVETLYRIAPHRG